jgi:hypothetical protein
MSYKPVTLYTSGVFNPSAFWTGNIFEKIEGYAPSPVRNFGRRCRLAVCHFMGSFEVG